jgi:hypothetical protein
MGLAPVFKRYITRGHPCFNKLSTPDNETTQVKVSKPVANMSAHKNDVAIQEQPDNHFTEKLDAEQAENVEASEERRLAERRIVRKLDMTLMPMVWVLFLFNYLDRNNIAQAKLNNIEEDLNLVGDQFNTAISILNVGYGLLSLPLELLLTAL